MVVVGVPHKQIVKIAEDGNYELIVMGKRGFSEVERFFVGSVTQKVLSEAHCPVLVVNKEEEVK
jgi:nucleotide-binding universal stress UspA family protein